MANIKNYNIKICSQNYYLNEKEIKWKLAPTSKTKYKFSHGLLYLTKKKTLYKTKFYNSSNKNKIYYMRIYILFSKHNVYGTLYVEGNLSDWYYQTSLGRNLSCEEYENCMNFLLSEIEIPKMDAKDIEESLTSFEYEKTIHYITKHKEFKDKKRHKRISKIRLT
ncbi:hypothetical protein [Flavobacterium daemonense]|uniref:hypothetical protein n=1 Tax=Flavobacterium daemonense TaxID=1393049 RepID=UPI00118699E1|nr:hypothetical protein [Flavobacterium daemonense]KAF2336149.1 hypothetical protein FND99_02380 [Flavobacterium daemonense]